MQIVHILVLQNTTILRFETEKEVFRCFIAWWLIYTIVQRYKNIGLLCSLRNIMQKNSQLIKNIDLQVLVINTP